ncbi:hypothetical protein ACHAWF_017084 [Thalassiosira exigua]
MTGKLTRRRYTGATIFVDHFSKLEFVHPLESLTSEEIIRAKEAFERFVHDHGIAIYHYHADNGRFKDNAFVQHCGKSNQLLSFCGAACNDYLVPINDKGLSKLNVFGTLLVNVNLKSIHTFGCPVYVLDSRLASGKSIKQWDSRARLGLNLEQSPSHACNASLVLSKPSEDPGCDLLLRGLGVVDEVLGSVEGMGTHPYGCQVVQRLVEHCVGSPKHHVLDGLAKDGLFDVLIDYKYGNYVVQRDCIAGLLDKLVDSFLAREEARKVIDKEAEVCAKMELFAAMGRMRVEAERAARGGGVGTIHAIR